MSMMKIAIQVCCSECLIELAKVLISVLMSCRVYSVAFVESYPRQPPPVEVEALLDAGARGRLDRGHGDRLVREPEEMLDGANCSSFHPSCTDDDWLHLSSHLDLAEDFHTLLSRMTKDDDLGLSDLKALLDVALSSSGLDVDR